MSHAGLDITLGKSFTHMYVGQSSIIWYWPNASDFLWLIWWP